MKETKQKSWYLFYNKSPLKVYLFSNVLESTTATPPGVWLISSLACELLGTVKELFAFAITVIAGSCTGDFLFFNSAENAVNGIAQIVKIKNDCFIIKFKIVGINFDIFYQKKRVKLFKSHAKANDMSHTCMKI